MGTLGKGWRLLAAAIFAGAVALIAVAVGAATSSPPPQTQNGIQPSLYEGGNGNIAECTEEELNPAVSPDIQNIFGLKIDRGSVNGYAGTWDKSNAGHTHGDDNPLRVTISNTSVHDGKAWFDWSANMPVDFVVVKAGSSQSGGGSLVYDYRDYGWNGHPALGPWGDAGLWSPNDSISHVLFCTLKKLRVEKTANASFTRTYDWTVSKQVKPAGGSFGSSATLDLLTGDSGTATWQIVADQTGATDGGATVSGSIVVLDSSPFDISGVLDESLSNVSFTGGCTKKPGTTDQANFSVGKGQTLTCGYSAPTSVQNGTNTVVADPTNEDWMVSTTASAPYTFGAPTEVNKTVHWSDSNGQSKGGITGDDSSTYDTTYTCDADKGSHPNTVALYNESGTKLDDDTASANVTCTPKKPLQVTKTAVGEYARTHDWSVHKSVSKDGETFAEHVGVSLYDGQSTTITWKVELVDEGVGESGYHVHGTITVTNPNSVPVTGVTVADPNTIVDCDSADGAQASGLTVPANGALTCSYEGNLAQKADTNTATADAPGNAFDGSTGPTPITWTATDLHGNVSLVDDHKGTIDGSNATYTEDVKCPGEGHSNTAEVKDGETVLDSDSADFTLTCKEVNGLEVGKTAEPRWTQDNTWSVLKTVNGGKSAAFDLKDGGTAAATWNVDVTKSTTNMFSVGGTITIKNSNAFDVSEVELTESLDVDQLDCTIGQGEGSSAWESGDDIPAGRTVTCAYFEDLGATKPEGTQKNTASASGTFQGLTVSGSATATYEFDEPDQIYNGEVTVKDDLLGKQWLADGSNDDLTVQQTVPCTAATVQNVARVLGDDTTTDGVETDHVLASDTASYTATCTETPPPPVTPPTTPPVTPPVTPPANPPATPPTTPPVLTPPTVKPKPKPMQFCSRLTLAKRTVPAGRRTGVLLTLKAAGKPIAGARIRLVGPGLNKLLVTGRNGKVLARFATTKPGIVHVSALKPHHSCTTQRLGAVGIFEPPLTG